jgi:C4-dicarboxylate-specific signal transduction histidine kinase
MDVLNDVLTISSQKINNLGIKIQVENVNQKKIKGHTIYLSHVLVNLLNNSIDALQNSLQKQIWIKVLDADKNVVIKFIDSGSGIKKEDMDKIMRPFFTTKEPGKGTGLGLSISKSLIEKDGGHFYFDTKSTETTFVIELPAVFS